MGNEGIKESILIVDDERDFALGLSRLISTRFRDVNVMVAHSGSEALQKLSSNCSLMLTDMRMPEMSGMELLKQALAMVPDLTMIMLTAHGTIETAVQALKNGAYDFITKPIEPDDLFRVIQKALERSRLLHENRRLKQMVNVGSTTSLVGESPAMQYLSQTISAVSQSDYTVLVRGESGTGKEMVARLIHDQSNRASKPFIAVNCPAIPEHLLESELFGHVKGAFTGADKDYKGLFAAAHGGTLLLDEIGDISPAIQTKLLRVLQEGEVRPVGSSKSRKVDVRVLASTNQDLESVIKDGSFREDLYYRLNVLAVNIPPLRERTSDIPLLALHFLKAACRDMKLDEKQISPEVLSHLSSKDWPGNVRELQSVVRRLTVFCSGGTIEAPLISLVEENNNTGPLLQADGSVALRPYKDAKAEVVDTFTISYAKDLLTTAKGNVSEAARISGLSRVALQKIMTKFGIDAKAFKN